VHLPKPDCNARPSDCADIDVLNTLDGFNVQPRITVPLTGAIDVNTVDSETVFLINLGDTRSGDGFGQRVGINQVSWDPGTNTLVFESDRTAERAHALCARRDRRRARRHGPSDRGRAAGIASMIPTIATHGATSRPRATVSPR